MLPCLGPIVHERGDNPVIVVSCCVNLMDLGGLFVAFKTLYLIMHDVSM